jgi:hypothetical protein
MNEEGYNLESKEIHAEDKTGREKEREVGKQQGIRNDVPIAQVPVVTLCDIVKVKGMLYVITVECLVIRYRPFAV